MTDDTLGVKPESVNSALGDMKLEEGASTDGALSFDGAYDRPPTPSAHESSPSTTPRRPKSASPSPSRKRSASRTPKSEYEEETIGGEITVTVEPGKAPKLSRKASQKVISRPPPLFDHLEDVTEESISVFQRIKECIYGSKYMGSSEHDSLDCDCTEAMKDGINQACGPDSDCINRLTKMECVDGECNCGDGCQNQRFQHKQYASVSVIKTDKKGYGLRANTDLQPDEFIFEYIGEVINEPAFRRRTAKYDEDGIKHFYFMSLTKHEFVDATKKGNLGRFCNHSCNPNCYVDKWVVGEKLRMGIFAERAIKAGEELVFNYNVDRYGAEPQPCYCGEPNCSGFIGGKTQTERATKLPHATIEALGIDDGDGWDTAVAKKPRKKKMGENDEEYVNNVQPRGLDEDGVRKVMATLMQCKEKWIAVKLLSRLQKCDDDRVRNRVVQMHGYLILRTSLTTWKDDNNVVLQILDILYKFPRLTRNKIEDSKIEATLEPFVNSEHEDVSFEAKRLLEEWSKLTHAYRIPRRKHDPNNVPVFERRNTEPLKPAKEAPALSPTKAAPTGPRSVIPQRTFPASRPRFRPDPPRQDPNTLAEGWFPARDQVGNVYYYSKAGAVTWQRPTLSAAPPPTPKVPTQSAQTARTLQSIIDSITKADHASQNTPSRSAPQTSTSTPPNEPKKPVEKWRALTEEKQMKLYENTLAPHVKYVMQKFTQQLSRDECKKFAKEVSKKLAASDFKHKRVEDPTKISSNQEKKVKKFVKEYFEKAVSKKRAMHKKEKEKAAAKEASAAKTNGNGVQVAEPVAVLEVKDESDVEMSEEEDDKDVSTSFADTLADAELKRKREDSFGTLRDETDSHKRLKSEEDIDPMPADLSPPPPPPPPPTDTMPLEMSLNATNFEANQDIDISNGTIIPAQHIETEEEKELRLQEEDLVRENEEAILMEMDGSLQATENLHGNGTHPGVEVN